MAHFFVQDLDETAGTAVVTGPDAFHLTRVLRMSPGDPLTLSDGAGRIFPAAITGLSPGAVRVRLTGPSRREQLPLAVTLVQGIAKGERMDLVVQKAVEIGVFRIIPMVSERTVARPAGEQKLARWRRIALEAAKQSRRGIVPEVVVPRTLGEVLDSLPPGATALLPWEQENGCALAGVLAGPPPEEAFLFIGPEGGFTAAEVSAARSRGVRTVSLGRRILRSETAGLVTLALVLFRWGDLGWTG